MKRSYMPALILTLLFVLIFTGFNFGYSRLISSRNESRNVTINRINDEISKSQEDPETVISQRYRSWKDSFGKDTPENITFLGIEKQDPGQIFMDTETDGSALCALYRGTELKGFIKYDYSSGIYGKIRLTVNIMIALCAVIAIALALFIRKKILTPFTRLSEYPERIAKMPDVAQLPEDRNRWFGKYIWSMNMLRDVLGKERKRAEKLECERQTLVASIAHSVKTPVMNIRLYAEALKGGLTLENGQKADIHEIADKIDSNAERIQKLTAEVIGASSNAVSAYEPEMEEFYLKDLETLVKEEYSQRMELARIPFRVERDGDPLIRSDRYGILRIISLLMDNAVKYGNGKGITVSMMSEDEGVTISVRNKGELLPEEELSFIFTSFRRGSNASGKEGSGIGLYTAKSVATALGGNIFARRLEDSGEMEFIVYIPL